MKGNVGLDNLLPSSSSSSSPSSSSNRTGLLRGGGSAGVATSPLGLFSIRIAPRLRSLDACAVRTRNAESNEGDSGASLSGNRLGEGERATYGIGDSGSLLSGNGSSPRLGLGDELGVGRWIIMPDTGRLLLLGLRYGGSIGSGEGGRFNETMS